MRDTAVSILQTTEEILGLVGRTNALPGPWGLVFGAIGAAAGFAADLLQRGADPIAVIATMRSAAVEFRGADDELEAYLTRLARAGATPRVST